MMAEIALVLFLQTFMCTFKCVYGREGRREEGGVEEREKKESGTVRLRSVVREQIYIYAVREWRSVCGWVGIHMQSLTYSPMCPVPKPRLNLLRPHFGPPFFALHFHSHLQVVLASLCVVTIHQSTKGTVKNKHTDKSSQHA
jgi:hypothetical protein